MIKVYIAGPYTGRTEARKKFNTDVACLIASELVERGFQPFVPHLSHYIDIISNYHLNYETWMDQDFHWLELCDCLYRLPGESSGADREVAFATKRGIPVFTTLVELEAFREKQNSASRCQDAEDNYDGYDDEDDDECDDDCDCDDNSDECDDGCRKECPVPSQVTYPRPVTAEIVSQIDMLILNYARYFPQGYRIDLGDDGGLVMQSL